ncbi:MAG: S8 family serine peptidase [bacterium]|nr:S8 family serine peptidase [bacterium]
MNKKIWGFLAAGTLFLTAVLPLSANDGNAEKFDSSLKLAMSERDGASAYYRLTGQSPEHIMQAVSAYERKVGDAEPVRVMVATDDGCRELNNWAENHAMTVTHTCGNFSDVILPFGQLEKISSLSHVVRIEASGMAEPENDVALAGNGTLTSGAGLVKFRKSCGFGDNLTGRGVILGIVDTGIDTSLDAFKDENGKTRVAYYWDMNVNDTSRYPTVSKYHDENTGKIGSYTFHMGSEYTAQDIDSGVSVPNDTATHGTHVAGIMGGKDKKYPGFAPDAEFIIVKFDNTLNSIPEAFAYIISRAREMGKPVVINFSAGINSGPHDGTALVEQSIQQLIDCPECHLIVTKSAGNFGDESTSAQATVPAGGSAVFPVSVKMGGSALETWLSTAGKNVSFVISAYSDSSFTAQEGENLELEYSFAGKKNIEGTTRSITKSNSFDNPYNNCDSFSFSFGRAGFYKIKAVNNSSKNTVCSIYSKDSLYDQFTDPEQCAAGCTITCPGTTPGMLTVGSYSTRQEWTNSSGAVYNSGYDLGYIAPYSSYGPPRLMTLFTGFNSMKPDIVAPGSVIISQLSGKGYVSAMYRIDDTHCAKQGTSMSSPMVAGMAALLLQQYPKADSQDIKEALFAAARSDLATGEVPNAFYGHGKLDAASLSAYTWPALKPSIKSCNTSGKNLIVNGSNFTASSAVKANNSVWKNVRFENSQKLILENLLNTYQITGKKTELYSITVANKGKDGTKKTTYTFSSPPSPEPTPSPSPSPTVTPQPSPVPSPSPSVSPTPSPKPSPTVVPSGGGATGGGGGGGCFIATAAYGSYMEPEVITLRRFRDNYLLDNAPGREFVKLYYTYSPPAANYIAERPLLRAAARCALAPCVIAVSEPWKCSALAGLGVLLILARRRRKSRQ